MAKYSDIKGFTVQTLSTDTIANQATGGAWASGGSVNTARYGVVSVGLQTAGLISGGRTGSNSNLTEQYNGSSWTEVNELNTARYSQQGAGTYTAALHIGGYTTTPVTTVEAWDGTNFPAFGLNPALIA